MGVVMLVLFSVATSACLAVAVYSWRQSRVTSAAVAVSVTLTGCALWSVTDLVTMVGPPVAVQVWAVKLSLLGIFVVVVGTDALARATLDPQFRPTLLGACAALAAPAAFLTSALICPVPGPFFHSIVTEPLGPPRQTLGPLYYLISAYCYTVLGFAYLRLFRARKNAAPVFRGQLNSMLVASLVPALGNVIAVVAPATFGHRDLTPLLFTCTGLFGARAVLRQGLLRIIPIARAQVLESITDSVLVLDARGRLIDANPAGRALVRRLRPDLPPGQLEVRPTDLGVPADFATIDAGPASGRRTAELLPGYHADLRTTMLTDSRDRLLGRVIVIHDISDLVSAQAALEQQLEVVERLRRELLEQTLRDPLTGVHNRRHLTDALRVALAQADRSGMSVALLVVDIDHFKAVNDELGHQAGDRALVAIAQALSAGVRPGDTVARFGGEEFVVVLPGASRSEAIRRAEELRAACSSVRLASADSGAGETLPLPSEAYSASAAALARQVTVSIGVAIYAADADDASGLIAAADHALYVAKATGRDRVVDAAVADLELAATATAVVAAP